jgi:nucleotide-binding universal stress UspA family protein
MISLKGILVPVDFSKESILAAKFAVSLALEYQSKLYVLHVNETFPAWWDYYLTDDVIESIMRERRKDLSKVIPSTVKRNLRVEEILETRKPIYHAIVKKAEELGVDMIVIATHGRTGLSHVLLGSVAEHVIRYASCPVFVVRNPKDKYVYAWE